MTRDEFLKGLATLNAPNQGMKYSSGGFDHDGPQYDDRTGEKLSPRYRSASLTVGGDRAVFLYRLIEDAEALHDALTAPSPKEGE